MVIVTYDEFGGQWDHVPPPGQGTRTPGPHDNMGPGTRIPALVLAPGLPNGFSVDHVSHARHDVGHGDDRAPLPAAAGALARCEGARPVDGVRRAAGAALSSGFCDYAFEASDRLFVAR